MTFHPTLKSVTRARKAPPRRPTKTPFDWIKWLIAIAFLAAGVAVTIAPFDGRAIFFLWATSTAFMSHHRRSNLVNRRLQFWGMLALGAIFGLTLAGGVWFMLAVFHVFFLTGYR
jgi:hypothetical protein